MPYIPILNSLLLIMKINQQNGKETAYAMFGDRAQLPKKCKYTDTQSEFEPCNRTNERAFTQRNRIMQYTHVSKHTLLVF